jgi:hypothetical protein
VLYVSCYKYTGLPDHIADAYNVGLVAVKHVINDRKSNWSKYIVINMMMMMMMIFVITLTSVRPYSL